ncbi:MAG: hypothetical protein WCD79_19330 [Chthoniobacteraceae bacterium]
MKIPLLSFVAGAAFTLSIFASTDSPEISVVDAKSTGAVTYTESLDGAEKEIINHYGNGAVEPYIWNKKTPTGNGLLSFGDSKAPGVRYLRVGFANPVTIGSILARGGGSVSVLKPGAALPGNVSDDSQWIPAERLNKGKLSKEEAEKDDEVVWTLPQTVITQAIRFTHTARPTDRSYAGAFCGAALLTDRWANLAPQALASASASDQNAFRLNDESADGGWSGWANIKEDGDRPKTIADAPEWTMLTWPRPVTLGGIALIGNQFGAAEIQTYTGPETKHPREAAEGDWKTIRTLSGVMPQYPSQFDLLPVAFDSPVTTRALRIRFTAVFDAAHSHPHMQGRTANGKRVSLGEWMALQSLNTAALETALLPAEKAVASHAPIPVNFTMPDAGEVTLVIEDATGKRIRNLISQTPFPKGKNTVWWDGTDDLGRDPAAPAHGIYFIPPEFVAPGSYTVRGLWHKPLDLRYEFAVYSPGDPPWPTSDGSGGWMTNHTPASCAVLIPGEKAPGGQPLIGIGAYVSEGGSAFSWVNLEGKKIGGRGWIGGVWTGAQYLAADSGPDAETNVATYVGSVFEGNKKYGVNGKIEVRLTKLTNLIPAGDKPVLKEQLLLDPVPVPANAGTIGGTTFPKTVDYLGGLAVHNGLLVFSETALNKIVFVDAKEGKILGEAAVPDPRALAFDGEGRLLLLSGQTLLRYPKGATAPNLPEPEKLVTGLEEPRGITVDAAQKIYIADQGISHQVKTFSPDGKPLAVYGKPGVPKAGPYDPLHMNHPKGIAVDTNGRLWVTEEDFQPKRVSVWNTDGTLWKAFYGPSQYGGGGIVDSGEKGTFLYDGMEFHLDWEKGSYELTRIYYRPGEHDLQLSSRTAAPESPVYFHGKRYLTDAYNSSPTSGQGTVFMFLDKGDGGAVVPVAAAGHANDWELLKTDAFKSLWPQGLTPAGERWKNMAFFIWSDLNGDGQVQPDEVKIIAANSGGVTVGDDGSFLISRLSVDKNPPDAMRFKPVSFTDQGAPVYDIAAGEKLAPAQGPGSDGGDQLLAGTDGWLVMTAPPPPFSNLGIGGARNGTPAWSYPSLWPGLHASHTSCAPTAPGVLVGTTRLLGGLVTPKGSEAGPLFFLNSNQGDVYAFTQDGLFVAQLFEDVRQGPIWEMPAAVRNMHLNDVSLHDENFFPSVAQTSEGKVYLNSGATMSIVRVDNLDTIRNIAPFPLQVTATDLKKAQEFDTAREAARQAAQGSGVLAVVLRDTAPALDGNLTDWADAQFAPIDHRGVAAYFDAKTKPYDVSGAVTIAGGKLFAAWKTDDPKLLVNAGDVPNALFKTGGALDLMIGADANANPKRAGAARGDERLLVSQVGGKTRALLYRPVVPGTAEKDKVPFNAPWHGITMDQVADVSDQVELASDGSGNYEIAVPLTVLGLDPKPGMSIKGDIGILRGNGKQTTQRVYWTNKATAIVSDVPSEAELTPALWGTWEFGKK